MKQIIPILGLAILALTANAKTITGDAFQNSRDRIVRANAQIDCTKLTIEQVDVITWKASNEHIQSLIKICRDQSDRTMAMYERKGEIEFRYLSAVAGANSLRMEMELIQRERSAQGQ